MEKGKRARWALAVAVGVVVGMVVPGGTAYAPPTAAPVRILDATNPNQVAAVDAGGALKVSGQVSVGGTSSVEVSNFPATQEISGEVAVSNYPGTATEFRHLLLNADAQDGTGVDTFSALDARFITISTDDEVRVAFFRPGSVVAFEVGRNHRPDETISIPIAVPLGGVSISCFNEVLSCQVAVYIIGT